MNGFTSQCIAFTLLFSFFASDLPGQELNPEALRRLKASTVFVKAETQSNLPRATGFFIDKNLIVTNSTLLELAANRVPSSITIVVASGTPREKEHDAEVVAYDPAGELAFLRVRSVSPYVANEFLIIGNSAELRETQNLFVAGFPFGEQLDQSKNPAVTIGPATLSSFRKNSLGFVEFLQIDGNLLPGNVGGPVVDTNGSVVGVSKSMVAGTQIGFAIPSDNLKLDLAGRIVLANVHNSKRDGNNYSFQLSVQACDPHQKIPKIEAYFWTGRPGAKRPINPIGLPMYGAAGDGPRNSIVLKKNPKDAAGQWYTADVKNFRLEKGMQFWVQALRKKPDGTSDFVSSVDRTRDLMKNLSPLNAAPSPNDAPKVGFKSPLRSDVPQQLIEPVQPNNQSRLPVVATDDEGVPIVESKIVSYKFRDVTSITVSPSGDAVYVAYIDVIEKYSPDNFKEPIAGISVPGGCTTIWCDADRVAAVTTEGLSFIDRELKKIIRTVKVPNLHLRAIAGLAPDNSLITVWGSPLVTSESYPLSSLYLIDETGDPRFLGQQRNWVDNAVFCFENQRLLLQSFRGSPAGSPVLFNLATQSPQSLSAFTLISANGMHKDFAPILSPHDAKSLVFSFSYNDMVLSKLVSPNLDRVQLSFPGAVFAEVPVRNILIAADTSKRGEESEYHPEILYVDRETGEIQRKVRDPKSSLPLRRFVGNRLMLQYVPGHELVLSYDKLNAQLHVFRCGPVGSAEDSDTGDSEKGHPLESVDRPDLDGKSKPDSLLDSLTQRFKDRTVPTAIVPSASPSQEFLLQDSRKKLDASGLPVTQANLAVETIQLGSDVLLQVVADPSGEKLYAIFENQAYVSVYDTLRLAEVGKITVPRLPTALWCGPDSLVVACDESKLVAFIDSKSGKLTGTCRHESQEKVTPINIVGPAPDGSLISIWKGVNKWSIQLVRPNEAPFLISDASGVLHYETSWCAFPNGPHTIWTQRSFSNSPSGGINVFQVDSEGTIGFDRMNAFGRKNFSSHRSCGHSFLSRDGSRFIVPLEMYNDVKEEFRYPMRTLIVRPDLSEILQEVSGIVIAESDANDCYIAWRPTSKREIRPKEIGIDILYISRSTGRVFRQFNIPGLTVSQDTLPHRLRPYNTKYPIEPTSAPSDSMLPRAVYVPGRELIVVRDSQIKEGIGRVQVVRCAPIPPDALVKADPHVSSDIKPPNKVLVGQTTTFMPVRSDVQGDAVKFRIVDGIPGMKIDEASGQMTFSPDSNYLGNYNIKVVAEVNGQIVPFLEWVLEVDLPSDKLPSK